MIGLLDTVATMPSAKPLFARQTGFITAGQIRKTATEIAARLPDDGAVFLHTASAALFVAGLLAASRKKLTVCFPAHLQPRYLDEIGAGILVTDQAPPTPNAVSIMLASEEESAAPEPSVPSLDLVFFTSGVTAAPKRVRKSLSQLDAEAQVLEQVWGAQAGHVFATVSHQHIYGMLFRVVWPLTSGRISQDTSAEYWENLSGRLSPQTTLVTSPAHLTRLPGRSILVGSAPGLIFSAGALLPFAAAQQAREQLGSLPIEVLGSTETGGIGWREQTSENALWTPLPGVDVATEQGGALIVTSPFVDSGRPVTTGDAAECIGQQFRLKSRMDRIVKIDGKRVSLDRVENALLSLPNVAAAAAVDLPSRKGSLGVIVELTCEGTTVLQEEGAFRLSRRLRTALAPLLEPAERPKHWRFETVAINTQGKRVQALLRQRFDGPEGTVVAHSQERAEISLSLSPDMAWFKGHFPEQPVLPGIVQVHLAALWASHLWGWKPLGSNLSQLKFRQILRPMDTVRLLLTRDIAKQRLAFAYELGDTVASQGMIGGAS